MRKFLIALAALALCSTLAAQTGPKYGKNGGIGSSSSTYQDGEPTGGTYAINGTTGSGTFTAANLRSANGPVRAHAPTNTALAALPSGLGAALRDGYYASGDTPSLLYVASGSACSLNAGAGDGGSQIPTSDGKCWLATFGASGIDVRQFGARCDLSVTNDAARIQAALTAAGAAGGGAVQLPGTNLCRVNTTITLPSNVFLVGQGGQKSGISAGATNLNPVILLDGNYSGLQDIWVQGNTAGTPTGTAVTLTPTSYGSIVTNLHTENTCNGLAVSGNFNVLTNLFINYVTGSGCNGITVGALTTGGVSTDISFDHLEVWGDPTSRPDSCFVVYDSGGLWISHANFSFCNAGLNISPGANQIVTWLTISDSYLGDANPLFGIKIDTASASAIVQGVSCFNCWASSSGANGVEISNTAGGIVDGLNFVGLRAYTNATNGFKINGGKNISISSSRICGFGASGVNLASGVIKTSLQGNVIGSTCDNRTGAGTVGVTLGGSNTGTAILGNDFSTATTGVSGLPTGDSVVASNNPYATNVASVASASTISLGAINDAWLVTGTTTITTISGVWDGRQVMLITPDGAVAFNTGGNICKALTSAQNTPVIARYVAVFGCWVLK